METVQARICAGRDLLTIRISDQGGGIAPEHVDKVFSYGFTTIPGGSSTVEEESNGAGGSLQGFLSNGPAAAPSAGVGGLGDLLAAAAQPPALRFALAGLGFGLPMSRLYARYFGGDLVLQNIPGYGVDVFMTLPYLDASHWEEQQETTAGDQVGTVGAQVGIQAATNLHQQLQHMENHGRGGATREALFASASSGDSGGGETSGSDGEVFSGGVGSGTDAGSSDEGNKNTSSTRTPGP